MVISNDNKEKYKNKIVDFFGVLKDNSKEWEKIKEKIYEGRKKVKLKDVKL